MNKATLAGVIGALLMAAGCAAIPLRGDRQQAGTLLKALREHEVAYNDAMHLERQLSSDEKTPTPEEVEGLRERFAELHARLAQVPVSGGLAKEYLHPLLQQLQREEADLARAGELLARNDLEGVRGVLQSHDHAENLISPAVKSIRRSFGFPNHRSWRGRPLTA